MHNRYIFSWFRLLLVGVVAYFGYVGFEQQMNINNIDQDKQAVEVRLSEAQKINQALLEEKKKLTQTAYIEKLAREDLGLVKKNEIPYILPNKN